MLDLVLRSGRPTSQWGVVRLLSSLICMVQNDRGRVNPYHPVLDLSPSSSSVHYKDSLNPSIPEWRRHGEVPQLTTADRSFSVGAEKLISWQGMSFCANSHTASALWTLLTASASNHSQSRPSLWGYPCHASAGRGRTLQFSINFWSFLLLLDKSRFHENTNDHHTHELWTGSRKSERGSEIRTSWCRSVAWPQPFNTEVFSSCLYNVLMTQKSPPVVSNCWFMTIFCSDTPPNKCRRAAKLVCVCVSSCLSESMQLAQSAKIQIYAKINYKHVVQIG